MFFDPDICKSRAKSEKNTTRDIKSMGYAYEGQYKQTVYEYEAFNFLAMNESIFSPKNPGHQSDRDSFMLDVYKKNVLLITSSNQ